MAAYLGRASNSRMIHDEGERDHSLSSDRPERSRAEDQKQRTPCQRIINYSTFIQLVHWSLAAGILQTSLPSIGIVSTETIEASVQVSGYRHSILF